MFLSLILRIKCCNNDTFSFIGIINNQSICVCVWCVCWAVCMRRAVAPRHLGMAEVLHLLGDLRRLGGEEVLVVRQHDVLDEKLPHCVQGDLLHVHLVTFDPEQADVPGGVG